MGRDPNHFAIVGRSRFQYTLPYGERPVFCIFILILSTFQYTLPYGERPAARTRKDRTRFQYTLPYGERRLALVDLLLFLISIHSPLWGETQQKTPLSMIADFNTLSPMGRDRESY